MVRACLALLLWPLWAYAATTYFVDPAGNDASDGLSRATAWRTFARVFAGINDAAIVGDDAIAVRPGRYFTLDGPTGSSIGSTTWRIPGVGGLTRGGSAGHPITFRVDTFYAGDVELTGSTPGNWNIAAGKTFDRTGTWTTVASECAGAGNPWACCSNPGVGCAGLYYVTATPPSTTTGVGPGVCFQPNATVGGAPAMWEILYAADTAPITMPTFTAARKQCWFREEHSNFCTGAGEPWSCCTAAGVGATCLQGSRVYAQASSGADPSTLSPPVEFPFSPRVIDLSLTDEVDGLTFSNAGNGRTFFFRWSTTSILVAAKSHDLSFADFAMGYLSKVQARCGSGSIGTCAIMGGAPPYTKGPGYRSGSGFPRDTSGNSYVINLAEGSPLMYAHSYQRGTIEKCQDECIHFGSANAVVGTAPVTCTTIADCTETSLGTAIGCIGSTLKCYYSVLGVHGLSTFSRLTFQDAPWEVLDGDTATYGYAYSWPPATYTGTWNAAYPTHFDPLGGGNETPGPWIVQSDDNTFDHLTIRRACGQASFEAVSKTVGAQAIPTTQPSNNLYVDNTYDATDRQYGSANAFNSVPSVCATSKCDTPTICHNGSSFAAVKVDAGGWDIDRPGNSFRNNVFTNQWGGVFAVINHNFDHGVALGRSTAPQFVNNSIDIAGNAGAIANHHVSIADCWGTTGAKGVLKNNVVRMFAGSDNGQKMVAIGISGTATTQTTTIAMDGNFYDAAGTNSWRWCPTASCSNDTTLAGFQGSSGADLNGQAGVPGYTSASDLHLTVASNAINAGRDLSALGFAIDFDGLTRPLGAAWDAGAFEYPIANVFGLHGPRKHQGHYQ